VRDDWRDRGIPEGVEGYGEARREAMDAAFGTQSSNKVGIYVELANKDNGLGQPLLLL
jgi:hypothetical protein